MTITNEPAVDRQQLPDDFFQDPAPYYRELREAEPVHWSDSWNCWLVTSYPLVKEVLNDTHFSCAGKSRRYMSKLPQALREKLKPFEDNFSTGLINSDPPGHTRLRTLVNQAFVPKVIKPLEPHIQSIVDSLLDAVADTGRMDAVQDFAFLLPTTVIARMLGVDLGDRDRFIDWATGINCPHVVRNPSAETYLKAQDNLLEMRDYFRRLYKRRQEKPEDDLMTRLAAAGDDGDKFTEDELLATNVTLLMAGFESTMSLIGNGLLALLRHPDQLEKLRNDPALIEPAVEELLRYVSPVQRQLRVVKENYLFNGKQLRRGDLAAALIGAANRDPDHFPDPDRLDIARKNNNHIAFGFGKHLCVGAHLARLEGQIAISSILKRFPRLRLTDAPIFDENILLRSLKSLPVAF